MNKGRKTQLRLFFRSAILTAVVLLCITAVFLGICKSYEAIKSVALGEEVSAVYIGRDHIRILDFVVTY